MGSNGLNGADQNQGFREMSKEEGAVIQAALMEVALAAKALPLDDFIAALDRADLAGPVANPELYRRAGNRARAVRNLAAAARKFQEAVDTFHSFIRQDVARQKAAEGPAKPTGIIVPGGRES